MEKDRPRQPDHASNSREVVKSTGPSSGEGGSPRSIKVLLVEDRSDDAALVLRELRRAGFAPDWKRVDNEYSFRAALGADVDIILADFTLPSFSVEEVLTILGTTGLDIPVIVVTGSIKEEEAVECIRRGVADYLLKDRLARLGQAVGRAIEDRHLRQVRRELDRSLRESEARYRLLVTRMPIAVFVYDEAGTVLYSNQAVTTSLGYAAETLRGQNLFDELLPGSLRDQIQKIDLGAAGTGHELVVTASDGSPRTLIANFDRFESAHGEPVTSVLFGVDITEQKVLEEQLRHAQKMEAVGRLAGGVAHDFNNLLTVITGYGQFLHRQLETGSPFEGFAAEILNAAQRASALTRQLLAFSRRQVLRPRVLDLNTVVSDMERMLGRLIGEDVELVSQLAPGLDRVQVDPGQIEQVVMNLAVNARDAMPNGGRLTIRTGNVTLDADAARAHGLAKAGAYVMLTVADTGVGMDAATRARIFEPFFTTKEAGKGTGLGLATVYGIVAQSGGAVDVESAPAEGAAFTIYLPITTESDDEVVVSSKTGPLRGLETILLVEDDQAVRTLARDALRRFGYRVVEATDGEHALEVSSRHEGDIHLVLTDVVMPKMGGRELAQRLAVMRPAVRILFVSGYDDAGESIQTYEAGGNAFLAKPYTIDTLARAVRKALNG
jgi:PAS domain S-box-containing protein